MLGSRVSLAWVGGIEEKSPVIGEPVEATKRRAATEFMIASSISNDEPYPGASWFPKHGLPPGVAPSAEFWEAHASYESTRSYARGVAMALGWVLGVIDDLAHITPLYWEDGSTLSDADRRACAQVLHAIEVRPLPPPARARLSRPRPGTSWIA